MREHLPITAACIGLVAGLLVAIPSARGDAKPRTISVDEIKDGMKGYGLTVFKGTEPERFDVEVVGVLRNFRPAQDLILVKTPHPRLNVTKNVRGMSGSPIYLDGRLAGAYAYSWAAFQVEPVAGVTPIAPMLAEMRRPIPPGFWPLDGMSPLPRDASSHAGERHATSSGPHAAAPSALAFEGAPGTYDLEAHAQQVAARTSFRSDLGTQVVRASTPLMLAGMSDRSMSVVRKLFAPLGLDPVQAGGGGSASPEASHAGPEHYVNGGGLGVQLARGDVSFMGLGTVTHVEGSVLCGFGHPMMEAGVTALPAAIGRVHWIFASDQHSSKIGEAARPLGALVQDRQSAVVVDETKRAPTFPLAVDIRGAVGAPKTSWRVEVAEERFMSSSLVASVLGSIVDASVNERRDVTWRLKSKLKVMNHGAIEVEDFGAAVGGMPDASDLAHSKIVRAVGEVMNNPWELTHIEGVETTLSVDYAREVWRLRGIDAIDPVVEPGQAARLRVHLVPFAGPEVTKVLEAKFPEELAGKEVDVEIVPGYLVAPDVPAPQSLSDLLASSTRQSLEPRSLVVQYRLRGQGVAYRGHVAEKLPTFALDALRPSSTDVAPEPFAAFARNVVPMGQYVEGADRVRIKVKPLR